MGCGASRSPMPTGMSSPFFTYARSNMAYHARARSFAMMIAVAVSATIMRGQQASIGYDDTPMQPDGKWRVHDSTRPRPVVVSPGPLTSVAPPSDALVLLGPGTDLSRWQATDGSPVSWPMSDGVLQTGKGLIRTRTAFADIQLHVEF